MKVILYIGITPNGFIAKKDGNSEFTSEEDLASFFAKSKSAGNIILGKNTFLECVKQGYFPFPEALNIVLSHEPIENKWGDQVRQTDGGPEAALKIVEEKGMPIAFVAGGGQVNASFLEKSLIDEIYFDVEPVIFGAGIPVMAPADFEFDLELLETKKLNDHTVQLHYKVAK